MKNNILDEIILQQVLKECFDINYEGVESFIKSGFNVNSTSEINGVSVLFFCVERMRGMASGYFREQAIKIIKLLIENKAKIDSFTSDGFSALHLAVQHKLYDVVDIFIENKVNLNSSHVKTFNGTALAMAIKNNDPVMIKKLTENGADINNVQDQIISHTQTKHTIKTNEKLSAINYAIILKFYDLIPLLIDLGCDVNKTLNVDGETSLTHLVKDKKYDLVAKILKCGANPETIFSRRTRRSSRVISFPLLYAIETLDVKMVKVLLDNGANPNFVVPNNEKTIGSALLFSLFQLNVGMMIKGENPDDVTRSNIIAFKIIVEYLVKAGADVYQRHGAPLSALEFARNHNMQYILEVLLPNHKTELENIVKTEDVKSLLSLLQKPNIDINVELLPEKTALSLALAEKSWRIARILIANDIKIKESDLSINTSIQPEIIKSLLEEAHKLQKKHNNHSYYNFPQDNGFTLFDRFCDKGTKENKMFVVASPEHPIMRFDGVAPV
ncbi:MAG: ankyrin repeat domain-containing protein [Pseudomonadota bacterium]|nr:ankyrin repeat domain-containing protein [Pseudomonadota bacterium]